MSSGRIQHSILGAILFLSCANVYCLPNDLLINEEWGINNVPRTSSNTPSSVSPSNYSTIGTCSVKPDISNGTYSCSSYTSTGTTDIDINGPEGWAAYSPSPTLTNPGEATGVDANHDGIDDGCQDGIDGDHNGYVDDCHGINTMVDRVNPDGTLNPAAGDPIDDSVGHGTNMAGVMAAIANNESSSYHGGVAGVTGIEPHIKIATCKSGDFESDVFPLIPGVSIPVASESAIRQCLMYFHNLKQAGVNIAVINASGGMSKFMNLYNVMSALVADKYLLNTPEMYTLADMIESDDIVVVGAAGNNGWDIDQKTDERAYFPAAFPNENIIGVGAIDNHGNIPSWSSYGRWTVDVLAPGASILSTNPEYPLVDQQYSDFVVSDGTSQATAYVTGIVAMIRANAATANLDAKAVRRLVMTSVKPLPNTAGRTVTGGLVRLADSNGRGALTCHDSILRRRQLPKADSMIALPTETVDIEVQNFNCASPGSETSLTVSVAETGQTITLMDDGTGTDKIAGDGVYSGSWVVPYGHFEYHLDTGPDSVTGTDDILTIKAGLVVDNSDSNISAVGGFWLSIYRPGFYGPNYQYATVSDTVKTFTWSPTVNSAGYYHAYARWPQGPNFATNATYQVYHQAENDSTTQVTDVPMNQTTNGNQWMDLGRYWFDAGTQAIELTNVNADGTVVADAIQLVPEP